MIFPRKVRSGEPIRAETVNAIIDAIADLQRISRGVRLPTLKRVSEGRKGKRSERPFTVSILGKCVNCWCANSCNLRPAMDFCLSINRGTIYRRVLIPCASITSPAAPFKCTPQQCVIVCYYVKPLALRQRMGDSCISRIWLDVRCSMFYTQTGDSTEYGNCVLYCGPLYTCGGTCFFIPRPLILIAELIYSYCAYAYNRGAPKICQRWSSDIQLVHFACNIPCKVDGQYFGYYGLPTCRTL